MFLIFLIFCVVFLVGSVLLIFLVFCVVVFGGIRVFNLFNFLCCVFCFVYFRHMSCVSNVASVSGLFIIDFHFGFRLLLVGRHRFQLTGRAQVFIYSYKFTYFV